MGSTVESLMTHWYELWAQMQVGKIPRIDPPDYYSSKLGLFDCRSCFVCLLSSKHTKQIR